MATPVSDEHLQRLEDLYNGSLPEYLGIENAERITISAAQYEGAAVRPVAITPADVIGYYRQDNPLGCNGMSGCRQLADFATDWRMVDRMAQESLFIFNVINRPALDSEAAKYGMSLRRV